ncbi:MULTISPECIES: M20 aminoacylase family protein [Ensifer]|jgi:hippurate hydrolase|uniref:Amidohydrolase n=1 Tax=Ensifer canadensis TaxID=555315 RepID=A0AAW4FDP9_9HYPH|nr:MULTISPECIES: M20 aminoacylase family protein [Ensifer]MDP9628487.1 hippurate hydrolase [Ensifer adhaerens]KQU98162.1 amidohydrolase [Ensifer sp. Root31]KQW62920.1 amidohydrolase [Ensifer sp. Root1252]KQW84937.1 amidohydrolase [Ensifer sp. Root127]KRC83741.1 amidohydrolase [Ensifer sp. Root231]
MKLSSSIDNAMPDLVAIRHDLHAHPELGLEETRTSAFIARHLAELGYEVTTGLAKTGVVGTLRNGSGLRSIGIRADIDALPILEETGLGYASKTPGLMHACGHDGHTTMLLGAARALAERRNFDGTIHLIFQPAEENFGGAKIMMDEGLFEKFPCDAVFALHNEPGLPFGQFALREGPIMAAVDEARITVHGRGGHGAEPQDTADPIVCGASIIMALQSIVSRNIHPMDPSVVTVGAFHAGSASNIIPERAEIVVGIRSFDPAVRDELERRIRMIAEAQAASFGMRATVDYLRSYDATINHKAETDFVRDLAVRFAGADKVIDLARPFMGSEDFAYMLQERPGTYFFLGSKVSGEEKPLHHPAYNFNDDLLPVGAAFWTELAEAYLPTR